MCVVSPLLNVLFHCPAENMVYCWDNNISLFNAICCNSWLDLYGMGFLGRRYLRDNGSFTLEFPRLLSGVLKLHEMISYVRYTHHSSNHKV